MIGGMLAAMLLAATVGNDDDVAQWEFEPVLVSASSLARGDFPEAIPEPVRRLLKEHRAVAAGLGLSALAHAEPPSVLFVDEDDEDGPWMLQLSIHALLTFRHKFQIEERLFRPLAVFHLDDHPRYESLLDILGKLHPYLENWTHQAKGINGFTIYSPLLVAVVENQLVHRDINRDNNLIHLVGHAALNQYFDVQPFWIREGLALDLEVTMLDNLYAMCSSDADAPITRPGNWRNEIKKSFRRRSNVSLDGLTGLRQEDFDRREILRSLGAVRFLVKENLEPFKEVLAALARDRIDNLRNDPYYLPDETRQAEIMNSVLGGDEWTAAAIESLGKGDSRSEIKAEDAWQVKRKKKSR